MAQKTSVLIVSYSCNLILLLRMPYPTTMMAARCNAGLLKLDSKLRIQDIFTQFDFKIDPK